MLGKFVDAIATAEQLLADSERFSELHDIGPDIFDLLTVLGFDGDEAISNQTAEVQGDLRAIAIGHRYWPTVLS